MSIHGLTKFRLGQKTFGYRFRMANIWIILADPKFPPRHYFPHSEKDEDKHGGGCRQSVGVRSKGDKLNWKETYRGDRLENV